MIFEDARTSKPELPEPNAPLPRGPHDFSPEVVERHQRQRLVVAVASVMSERGYGGLTVAHITAAARISRSTFYEIFSDKQEAVLVAHEFVFERFLAALERVCAAHDEWSEKVKAGIGATLELAAAEPELAQLVAAEFLSADLILAQRVRRSHDQLAALLGDGRRLCPADAPLPALTERALVGAISAIVARSLVKGEQDQLPALKPQLVEFVLLPYLGPAGAARAAASAA